VQADGVVLVKTNQAVLVAEYVAPVQAPEATPIVESLGDYLKQSGY
jgi:profilin